MALRSKLLTSRKHTSPDWNRGRLPSSWARSMGNYKPGRESGPVSPIASQASSIGGGAASPSGPADPRDAQYFNDSAKLLQYHRNRLADIQSRLNETDRDYTKNSGLLAEQQPKDTLAAKVSANKAGLFHSGFLGKNLGEIETSYARRRGELLENFTGTKAGLLRDYANQNADYQLQNNDILLGSIGRQTERDSTLGVPGVSPAIAAVANKATASVGRPQKTVNGRRFYQRGDGKWIPF